MDWGRVRFFLSEVWRSFSRNVLMQLTAVGTVAVTILILGGFLFAREALGKIGDDVVHKIEISVFLSDKSDRGTSEALQKRIVQDTRVAAVTFIPKADGLRLMRERLRGQIDTSLLTTNPLPDAMRVNVKRPEDVRDVAAAIRKMPNVASVEYAQDAVEKMLRVGDMLGRIGLGIVALLVLTASIIISNTIRLTVFARRREIAIMQLVGASAAYIRGPFIFEGFIDGLLGAGLALGALSLARHQLLPKLVAALPFVPLRAATINEVQFAFELLGVGAAVGIVAAWFSVGRHLRA